MNPTYLRIGRKEMALWFLWGCSLISVGVQQFFSLWGNTSLSDFQAIHRVILLLMAMTAGLFVVQSALDFAAGRPFGRRLVRRLAQAALIYGMIYGALILPMLTYHDSLFVLNSLDLLVLFNRVILLFAFSFLYISFFLMVFYNFHDRPTYK